MSGIAGLTMKIFDWKRRDAYAQDPSMAQWTQNDNLGTLASFPGSRKERDRKGRGISAGQGHQCGKGMRGQNSRSGGSTRPGFEGGQTPIYRQLPKYVGRPMGPGHIKTTYGLIKLDVLNKCQPDSVVSYESCLEQGFMTKLHIKKGTSVRRGRQLIKVIGCNDADRNAVALAVKGLTVKAHAFTASAAEQIQALGGRCVLLNPVTNEEIQAEGVEQPAEEAVAA
eukprot:CAMPEP_0113697812 /NCGR_PEP_ID=MMETSP0038_2-20120614/22347_1 /TAXON_ID=2898 /ORGANISM="Cryptomonas paramecium" /LENGTH=224 /DNA_ID=CAMNT_0000620875 /DNA_START=155 /DNA_END=829 /DNA_ORIENTATION=+ /assembly_acc=CAM_ASM_000170